jgi:hypothetical protein
MSNIIYHYIVLTNYFIIEINTTNVKKKKLP